MQSLKNPYQSKKTPIPEDQKGGRHLLAIRKSRAFNAYEAHLMFFFASECNLGENATFMETRKYSREYIAENSFQSPSSVSKYTASLRDKGYLIIYYDEKNYGVNGYALTRKVFDEYLEMISDKIDPPARDGEFRSAEGGVPQRGIIHNPTVHNKEEHNINNRECSSSTNYDDPKPPQDAHKKEKEVGCLGEEDQNPPRTVHKVESRPPFNPCPSWHPDSNRFTKMIFLPSHVNKRGFEVRRPNDAFAFMDEMLHRHGETAKSVFENLIKKDIKLPFTLMSMQSVKKTIEDRYKFGGNA